MPVPSWTSHARESKKTGPEHEHGHDARGRGGTRGPTSRMSKPIMPSSQLGGSGPHNVGPTAGVSKRSTGSDRLGPQKPRLKDCFAQKPRRVTIGRNRPDSTDDVRPGRSPSGSCRSARDPPKRPELAQGVGVDTSEEYRYKAEADAHFKPLFATNAHIL